MAPLELRELAESQPHLYLTLDLARLPTGDRVRLCGRRGPYGRLCNVKETEEGYRAVAVFDSQKILAFIKKEGLA